MKYRFGNKNIDINNRNLIGYGTNGNVYRIRKDAIKIFPKGNVPNDLIDLETCRRLCDISTNSILLPKKIVYYNDNFSGYSLKLIKKTHNKSILNMNNVELIDSIKLLEEDITLLSKKGVLLDGITPSNVIISDKLYLTDPSKYSFIDNEFCDGLYTLNSYQLHLLISKIILSSLKKNDISSSELKSFKNYLLNKDIDILSSEFFSDILSNENNIKTYVKNRKMS